MVGIETKTVLSIQFHMLKFGLKLSNEAIREAPNVLLIMGKC